MKTLGDVINLKYLKIITILFIYTILLCVIISISNILYIRNVQNVKNNSMYNIATTTDGLIVNHDSIPGIW